MMKPPNDFLGEFAWSPFYNFTLYQCKLKYFHISLLILSKIVEGRLIYNNELIIKMMIAPGKVRPNQLQTLLVSY